MRIEQAIAITDNLANALALHEAMSRACRKANAAKLPEALAALQALLQDSAWPLREQAVDAIQDFREGRLSLEEFLKSDEFAESWALPVLRRDLSIWIVERFYRPCSLDEVKRLYPGFVKAGLGFLLYRCFEQQKSRDDLTDYELLLLQHAFEDWITAIWVTNWDFIAAFEEDGVTTTAQLIAWLQKHSETYLPILGNSVRELLALLLAELQLKAA